jgi:glucokinase
MVENSRQALVGAIGGTYISLAIADIDELTLSNFALLNSASFKSPMEAIQRYLNSVPRCPDKVGLAIAGRLDGEMATMTNLPWTFDWNDIRAVTGASRVTFVNEFEALALATPHMSRYDFTEIGHGEPNLKGTRLAISAGTGLGAAALILNNDKWFTVSGESRHVTFPMVAPDFDLSAAVGRPLSTGDVLTGRGLVALYDALAKAEGVSPVTHSPEEITKAGLGGKDPVAKAALDQIAVWLGRFAGDVALHFGATGGVYLGGGLPSNIVDVIHAGRFREAFDGIGARAEFLHNVPVRVLKTGADAGMRGAAVALADSLPVRGPSYRRLSA